MNKLLDHRFMRSTVRYSSKNLGLTGSNPCVGAFIVQNIGDKPTIIGRGVTMKGGRPHAETCAISEGLSFLGKSQFDKDSIIYVTLEPCSHYGKTPPCVKSLIDHKIGKVIISLKDPDPRVNGRGIAALKEAGIPVLYGIETNYALDNLFPYFIKTCFQRPQISLKLAISKDNAIGFKDSKNYKLTNALSHERVHLLRAQHNAILIGAKTALQDDPLLTCRLKGLQKQSPIRILIDPSLSISYKNRLVETAWETPFWIVAKKDCDKEKKKILEDKKVRIILMPFHDNKLDLVAFFKYLLDQEIVSIFVEGGAKTAEYFLEKNYIDRLFLFRGQKMIEKTEKKMMPSVQRIYKSFEKNDEATYDGDFFQEWRRNLIF